MWKQKRAAFLYLQRKQKERCKELCLFLILQVMFAIVCQEARKIGICLSRIMHLMRM